MSLRSLSSLARAAVVAAAVACSESTAPGGAPLAVAFEVREAGYTAVVVAPTVTAGVGEVVVAGRIVTGDPCQEVTARATRDGEVVTLTVTAKRVGELCIAVVAAFDYTATVRGLGSGTHTLRVEHAHDSFGRVRAERVLEQGIVTR